MWTLGRIPNVQPIGNMLQVVLAHGLQAFIPAGTASGMPIGLLPTLVTNEDSGPIHWTVRALRVYKLRLREVPNGGVF